MGEDEFINPEGVEPEVFSHATVCPPVVDVDSNIATQDFIRGYSRLAPPGPASFVSSISPSFVSNASSCW